LKGIILLIIGENDLGLYNLYARRDNNYDTLNE